MLFSCSLQTGKIRQLDKLREKKEAEKCREENTCSANISKYCERITSQISSERVLNKFYTDDCLKIQNREMNNKSCCVERAERNFSFVG